MQRLQLVEAIVFGAALLATGIAGAAWVRLSLRPLRRVAATASRVAQLPLAGGEVAVPPRVPDTDPRTEVGQVGSVFNRMLRHVEDSLARRHVSEERLRRFAADAGHELRTPVASIRGHAELALLHPGPVPDKVRHALDRVRCESLSSAPARRLHAGRCASRARARVPVPGCGPPARAGGPHPGTVAPTDAGRPPQTIGLWCVGAVIGSVAERGSGIGSSAGCMTTLRLGAGMLMPSAR